jgi:GNAT superfamily N-acetyltransferase
VTRFLARLDGVPVSAVTVTRSGQIAGIWSMGTARSYQGQGAGRAVLEHAIAYEQGRGAEWFFLGASDEGRPLYEKLGFREVARAGLWTHDPAQPRMARTG